MISGSVTVDIQGNQSLHFVGKFLKKKMVRFIY